MEKIKIPNYDDITDLAQALEKEEDTEVIKREIGILLEKISEELHAPLVKDVSLLYEEMSRENCLVRVEKLSRIVAAIKSHSSIKISDEEETHYANAVIPSPEGIKIAFSEGQAPGPVRIAVGFGKTIVGFKTENLKVEEIDFNESEIRDSKERAYLCRHVVGDLKPEDIKYIVIRIPRNLIDPKHLTAEEKKSKTPFIFRGFDLFDEAKK